MANPVASFGRGRHFDHRFQTSARPGRELWCGNWYRLAQPHFEALRTNDVSGREFGIVDLGKHPLSLHRREPEKSVCLRPLRTRDDDARRHRMALSTRNHGEMPVAATGKSHGQRVLLQLAVASNDLASRLPQVQVLAFLTESLATSECVGAVDLVMHARRCVRFRQLLPDGRPWKPTRAARDGHPVSLNADAVRGRIPAGSLSKTEITSKLRNFAFFKRRGAAGFLAPESGPLLPESGMGKLV